MSRNLTRKQSEFAAAVAQGTPLAQAYRTAYRPKDPMAPSIYSNSRRALKHAGIAARINELQLELLPAPEDMKAVYAHGLATIIQLSTSSEDVRVRLRAAQWLCAEAEKREKLDAARSPNWETLEAARPSDREQILSELAGLYRKALGPREPLVEEVTSAAAAEESEGGPVGEVELPEESSIEASCETAAVEDVEEPGATTAPAVPRYTLERTTPAGFFPARFKRIPIGLIRVSGGCSEN